MTIIDQEKFIQFYKDNSDSFTMKEFGITKNKLLKILDELKIQQHSKAENTKLTNLRKYGCTNVMSSPEIKAHFKELYGGSGSPFCKKEVRDKRDDTVKSRYNVDNVFQIESVKKQIKDVQTERYGAIGFMSTYQKDIWHKYKYDGISFDSSWEIALWIYAKEHEINIIREPINLRYSCDDGEFDYIPDFLYDGELIEVKGDHLILNDAVVDPRNKWSTSRCQAKYECMLNNNVKILLKNDIQFALNYVIKKFNNDKKWYKQFENQ